MSSTSFPTLTAQIINGTAPSGPMLCASQMTPLLKKEALGVEGVIRPIAVGEVIYRLALKSIVRQAVKREMQCYWTSRHRASPQ